MPDYDESDPLDRIRRLEETTSQLVEAMTLAASQLQALFVVSAGLVGVLRDHVGVDIELMRTKLLEVLPDEVRDATAIAHVNALLGPVRTDTAPPTDQEERDRLREVARPRFTVIEGGRPEGAE
ncbi:hypothetical protein [Methylobacterium sp. AMS5]|uniref:hypothetical protein n=1 Tax=Methylobacterium sp. AMS5 TaxID=925818 RepID=UPI00074F8251|nr:hypothetical protein [Methylobacterium sp. AMS5]AMB46898.1 hypothetical protein Y590_18330 [Methylobacterium sp. AMS5]